MHQCEEDATKAVMAAVETLIRKTAEREQTYLKFYGE